MLSQQLDETIWMVFVTILTARHFKPAFHRDGTCLEKCMVAINDTGDDLFVLIFSDDPPRVRDSINPFTLLSWDQSDGDLSVNSYVIDDAGEPQERCMKVRVLPNNAHAIRTLEGWLPSGKRLYLVKADEP